MAIISLDGNNNIIGFPANNNDSISFKFKQQMTVETENGDRKVSLKYLSNVWSKSKCL